MTRRYFLKAVGALAAGLMLPAVASPKPTPICWRLDGYIAKKVPLVAIMGSGKAGDIVDFWAAERSVRVEFPDGSFDVILKGQWAHYICDGKKWLLLTS